MPIIGIQVNLVQIGDTKALNVNKVIDTYEEPEESETSQPTYDENYWLKNYAGSLECARWYRSLLEELYGEIPVKYFESYISLSVGGLARVWVNRRGNRVTGEVKIGQNNLQAVVDHLNAEGFSVRTQAARGTINFNVNLQQLSDKVGTHKWLASRLSPENLKTDSHQSKPSS